MILLKVFIVISGLIYSELNVSASIDKYDGNTFNVIGVPQGCPAGYKHDANGNCRPIWFVHRGQPQNIITAPTNCPTGQKPDVNGVCRDEWFLRFVNQPLSIITAPTNCPSGQKPDVNGVCRDEWFFIFQKNSKQSIDYYNSVALDCPAGYRIDAKGVCRSIWFLTGNQPSSIITAPTNCPPGQKPDVNGVCRDEWFRSVARRSENTYEAEVFEPSLMVNAPNPENKETAFIPGVTGERSIMGMAPNCPKGQVMNSLGKCRTVF